MAGIGAIAVVARGTNGDGVAIRGEGDAVSGLIARFIGVVINRVEVLVIFLTDAAICSRSVQMPTC